MSGLLTDDYGLVRGVDRAAAAETAATQQVRRADTRSVLLLAEHRKHVVHLGRVQFADLDTQSGDGRGHRRDRVVAGPDLNESLLQQACRYVSEPCLTWSRKSLSRNLFPCDLG
jgi:hypothetical protein